MSSRESLASHRQREVEHYVFTGESVDCLAGSMGNFLANARETHSTCRAALIAEVSKRTIGILPPRSPGPDVDVAALVRGKLAPMVRGLFPPAERDLVLRTLGRSVIFLTSASIESVLAQTPWPRTAWNLANLYLASVGADLLADDAPRLVGLSEGTTCYVSMDYFGDTGRFDDFVVHEAAHVFHNSKRVVIGLPAKQSREWLLDIDFSKRETFSYACEAYSRILELASQRAAQRALIRQIEEDPMLPDDRVDPGEYLAILRAAVEAPNGWKAILRACAQRSVGPVLRYAEADRRTSDSKGSRSVPR